MNYLKHYDKLILRARNRVLTCYTENHHVIPRCMGGTDDPDNIVALTPEEHYTAHLLLAKAYPDHPALLYACMMMTASNTNVRRNNKSYGWVRRKISERMKENNPNKDGKSNRARAGKYNISEQAKKNISKGMKLNGVNVGEKNGMFKTPPWLNVNATEHTRLMWSRADEYYKWWIESGLEYGMNPMAKAFNEKYSGTHGSMVKKFRDGWVPENDNEWRLYYGK